MKKLLMILMVMVMATMSARALTGAEETALIGLAAGALGYGGATATNGLAPLQFLGLQAGKTRLGKWLHGASGPDLTKYKLTYVDGNRVPLTNGIYRLYEPLPTAIPAPIVETIVPAAAPPAANPSAAAPPAAANPSAAAPPAANNPSAATSGNGTADIPAVTNLAQLTDEQAAALAVWKKAQFEAAKKAADAKAKGTP